MSLLQVPEISFPIFDCYRIIVGLMLCSAHTNCNRICNNRAAKPVGQVDPRHCLYGAHMVQGHVRSDNGLIFPLEGISNCGSPEIALARDMGAELTIEHGIIVPWLYEVRPIEMLTRSVAENRAKHDKGSQRARTRCSSAVKRSTCLVIRNPPM